MRLLSSNPELSPSPTAAATAAPAVAGPRPWRTVVGLGALAWIAANLGLLWFHAHTPGSAPWTLTAPWVHWDGNWYAGIAQAGYWLVPGQQSPVAFFPLYPLLIRGGMALGLEAHAAGVLLAMVSGAVALRAFRGWAGTLVPASTANTATVALAAYPFAFYLYSVMYSDALALALTVCAFWALERRRLALAVLLGALATATRPIAPAVVAGLLLRQLELSWRDERRLTVRDAAPLLAGLGLLAYMAYLGLRFGDPIAFAHVQSAPGWDQPPGWSTWLKLPFFHLLATNISTAIGLRLFLHPVLLLWFVLLVPATFRRLGPGYGAYVVAALILPAMASKDFHGIGRYLLTAFPAFLTFATLLEGRPRLRLLLLAGSAAVMVLLAACFGAGAYVA